MPNLTHADLLVVLLYLASVLGVGQLAKASIKSSIDFFQAGRMLPAWITGLACFSVSLGAPVVLGMGGLGARYGLHAAHLFVLGAVPALVFAGIFVMPLYWGSKARSVPEFLSLRFDEKTRQITAVLFLGMSVFASGVSMYALAHVIQELHLFDTLFLQLGWPRQDIFLFSTVLASLFVALYVFLGGLCGAMYNQVLQFFVLVAGLLPVVLLGLKNVGSWAGIQSLVSGAQAQAGHATSSFPESMGVDIIAFGMGIAFWYTSSAAFQNVMASRDAKSARRASLFAAIPALIVPFLLVLPGALSVGLPTPHSRTTVTAGPDGAIVHNIDVVAPEIEQGKGLVPAKSDPVTGKIVLNASGKPVLDYDMATPNLLLQFLPTGILGLGLAALLASFMTGLSGHASVFSTVFTCDLYQAHMHRDATDEHYIKVGRVAVLGGILLSFGAAFVALRFANVIEPLLLAFSIVNAPLLAPILLGVSWKRTTGHGAFAGLLAGVGAALLHHGLTLPLEAQRGIHGGWIAEFHRYPSEIAQNVWGAVFAFAVSMAVVLLVSVISRPKPEAELAGLVCSLTPRLETSTQSWWKRPAGLVIAVALVAWAIDAMLN